MADYVTRAEFDEVIDDLHTTLGRHVVDNDVQHRRMQRQLGRLDHELGEVKTLLRRVARHLGIDPNGDQQ